MDWKQLPTRTLQSTLLCTISIDSRQRDGSRGLGVWGLGLRLYTGDIYTYVDTYIYICIGVV